MGTSISEEYEKNMLEAFIKKPSKFFWYKKAFTSFENNRRWYWSWWAFFGGPLFFWYRKAYILALFSIPLVVFFPLIGQIIIGGFGVYFIYRMYKERKKDIESIINIEDERIDSMHQISGYHGWIIFIIYAWMAIIFLGILAASIIPRLAH